MLDLNTEKINHNANGFSRLAKYGNVLCGLLNNFGGSPKFFPEDAMWVMFNTLTIQAKSQKRWEFLSLPG